MTNREISVTLKLFMFALLMVMAPITMVNW
jgi:hypothetical protein